MEKNSEPRAGAGRQDKSSLIKTILKLLIAAALLIVLIVQDKISLSAFELTRGSFFYVGLAFVLFAIQMLFCIIRFFYLVKAVDGKCGFYSCLSYSMTGLFFSIFALGNLGGDVIKAYMLSRHLPGRLDALVIVTVDRLTGLAGLLLMAFGVCLIMLYSDALSMPDGLRQTIAVIVTFFILLGVLLSFFISHIGAILTKLEKCRHFPGRHTIVNIMRALLHYKGKRKVIYKSILMSVVSQFFTGALVWCCALALSASAAPSLLKTLFASTAGFLANLAPLPAGGIGAGEFAFANAIALLGEYGAQAAGSWGNIFLLFRFVLIAFSLTGLIFYILDPGRKNI